MKSRIDFRLAGALLRKQWTERLSAFRGGLRRFDLLGFLLKLLLAAGLVFVFVTFFSKFVRIYLGISLHGVPDVPARQRELLTLGYTLILIALTAGGTAAVDRSVFGGELRLFSALPVGAETLFFARAASVYLGQLALSFACVLPFGLTFAAVTGQTAWYFGMSVAAGFLLPLLSMALSGLLALPVQAVKRFLRRRFLLSFVLTTLAVALGFFAYSLVLDAVRGMLLGDELKYFFDEDVMRFLTGLTGALYPARWLADFVLGKDLLASGLGLFASFLACALLSLLLMRRLLALSLRREQQEPRARRGGRSLSRRPQLSALLFKELNDVFRTPGYAFSYFSVAAVMPLMVYFCMSVGASLVRSLVFVDCGLELALFLTILFGVLTNTFCATNVSREGNMFDSLRAMPLTPRQVVLSKVLFCALVAVSSNFLSALVLYLTRQLSLWNALFVFGSGALLGFAQICFATRKDLVHARFSEAEEGELRESTDTVSSILVLGLLSAVLLGGGALLLKMAAGLTGRGGAGCVTPLLVGGASVLLAALALWYLLRRLDRRFADAGGAR